MAIISYTNAEQESAKLCEGNINVKKQIGFPDDDGLLKSYSNLFYWAYIRSDGGGEINDLSKKGFVVLTFLIHGEIEYYNSLHKEWKKLITGDMQVAMSVSGFARSERFMPGASLIRIWVDPDLEISLNQKPSCDDYASDLFPVDFQKEMRSKIYVGPRSPAVVAGAGLLVREIALAEGLHVYTPGSGLFVSGFVLEGELKIKSLTLRPLDFFIAKDESEFQIQVLSDCRIFIVESPVEPGYPTYAEKFVM